MLAALDRPPAPCGRGGSRRLPVLGPAMGPALRASSVCGARLGSAPGRFPPRFGRAARRSGARSPPPVAAGSGVRQGAGPPPAACPSGLRPCLPLRRPLRRLPSSGPCGPRWGPWRLRRPRSSRPGGALWRRSRPFALRAPRAPGPSACACIRSGGGCLRRSGPGALVCKAVLLVRVEKSMLDNRA